MSDGTVAVAGIAAPATLTIDLGALADNWCALRDRGAARDCAAVVKADAYGIGIEPAVAALAGAGCRTFFVAHLGEAARVRATAPESVVYVFNGLLPGTAPSFHALGARPVLGSRDEVRDWAESCDRRGQTCAAAIHVDTGMNRLGLPTTELAALATDPAVARFRPTLLMSHLVAAEMPDEPVNARQVAAFAEACRAFPDVPSSLLNSSGIFLTDRHPGAAGHALARPGYALYGGNPTPGRPNPMRPVVRLETRVVQTRRVEAGETVGYGGRWTARRPSRLATLSVGYADGYLRSLSGLDDAPEGGAVLVDGVLCPLVGRVSMDLVVADVTGLKVHAVARGAPATLIGDALDIDEVGRRAGTIGYEILTGLGRRYERHYIGP